jgi:hypothetical protein
VVTTVLLNQKYEIFSTEEQKEMLDRWLHNTAVKRIILPS